MHTEYNVHFIATSNLAEPLEMAEAIVNQIECITSNVSAFTSFYLADTAKNMEYGHGIVLHLNQFF